jgi:hypothetical protein
MTDSKETTKTKKTVKTIKKTEPEYTPVDDHTGEVSEDELSGISEDELVEAKISNPYESIDLKFVSNHKKFINRHIENYAKEYLAIIRPLNEKTVSIDAQAKDQIMYIFCRLLNIVSGAVDIENIPDDSDDIPDWIEKCLDPSTSNCKIYKFLKDVTHNIKYDLIGEKIEENMLEIISKVVVDEDLMQHTVELFILFIKKFAESLANINWESTKRTNSKITNSLFRNMCINTSSPDIFEEIYGFGEYCKERNKSASK